MKGIDVSNNNRSIDFENVKNDGIEVVIIKATEGVDWVDPYFQEHYERAKNAHLNIGFYHFMSERTSASQQANDFWNAIKDKQFNVMPCLDIETNNMDRSTEEISDRCIEFLQQFKNLSGMDCMIYTGGYFGRDNLDSRVKQYKGWIAHYGVDTPMETGFEVIGHQYTEKGSISGVNGNVDMNNFTEEIFIDKENKEESVDMKKIVTYLGDADLFAAIIVAQKNQCALMRKCDFDNSGIKVDEEIVIGGKPGSNRFSTFKDAAELV